MSSTNKIIVEVVLKQNTNTSTKVILTACQDYLTRNKIKSTTISSFGIEDSTLANNVEHIILDIPPHQQNFYIDISNAEIYFYTLNTIGPQMETFEDDCAGQVNLATHWLLPSASLFNIWENLIYDDDIKNNLLDYANSMMVLSTKGVDSNIISYNRVILLHGPPGTGKTSLCRALAHKLSIRLQFQFKSSLLIEINSQSLFSKWFSESAKLVTKMFANINDIIADTSMFVCILIDEIESLTHAREYCMSGNEPSDSIKVVNAMLTHIDQIKSHPNVLLLTTSNITGAIDAAFLDRADIKQYLGLPGEEAIFKIYLSCLRELVKTQVIVSDDKLILNNYVSYFKEDKTVNDVAHCLKKISRKSIGLSGRTLRKIPLLAHALFAKTKLASIDQFIEAMSKAISYEIHQRNNFVKND